MDLSTTLDIIKSIVKALKGIVSGDIDFENLSSNFDKLSSSLDGAEGSSKADVADTASGAKDTIVEK
ncbi:MAG: hypothetical protein SPK00_06995 [Corynebacterium glucuronolyticum]|nr:hypothetical protein [Corynebacterium glucuronolyticum]MDD7586995.1 hypothetical protein [Mycobacteriaceae bacterium]MDY5834478.1 hypothetical protein [Corynebacterium glucuronolyticum]